MIKHVGKHGDKKVVILYRQVPNEDHMCLLVYSDLLPRLHHDTIMQTLEQPIGQQAESLADPLFRTLMADGRNILEVLHKEGFIKKVPTNQVIMTPTPSASVRLDELNSILTEMAKGEEAIKRMKEIDEQTGLQKRPSKQRDVGEPATSVAPPVAPLQASDTDALSDQAIANQQRQQATRMRIEANSMLAEATRLEQEADALSPSVVPTSTPAEAPAKKRGPGRPKGAKNVPKETAKG